uniref:Condensin complex subunit 1 C-terminal domain-containing protein n=1 Tax=Salix viminalis TaxID=40686 RepID=A0A6N2LF39_SALVM
MASTTSSSLPQDSATPPLMSLPLLLRAKLRSTPGNPSSAINWSPPPISRLRPPSLGSQKSPLLPPQRQSYLSSTRDYLRSKAMEILESPDTLPLSCFIEELNFPETSTDLMRAQNLLNYLENNYLASFCFCLISFYNTCGSEFKNCKEYAFDILCLILTQDKEGPWKETFFLDKEIKSAILYLLNTESSIKILNKIRHFVAKFATKELLEFVYESLDSASEEKVKYAVSLLYKLIPHCAVEDLVISLDSIYDSLVDIFDSDDESLEVQVEAVLTSNRFLLYWTNRFNHDRYSVLMIEIVETISSLVEHKSDKDVQAIVKELTVLAKEKPWTLSSQFDYVVLSVIRIAEEVELQDKTRILALEFVIALAEERVEGQQMLLGSHRAIPNIFEKILLLLANLKDDSEWEWAESDIQNLPSVRCLDRIVSVLGGEVLMKNFPRLFDINFCAEDWRSRHAAVLSLAIVAERCSNLKESKHSWNQMAGRNIRSVNQDTHPCVRWTALYAIKQFSKHLKPEFQDQYHEQVLPALTKAMDDFNYPRVQVQAYSALYEFTSNCTSSILNPYLKDIDQFSEYYGVVMPYLKVIMMTAKTELDHNLIANSVDCITMAWMAVGKEKIRDDIDMVVKMLISLQRSELEANDPMRCQLLQAWARLGKCLGQEFKPYMSVAIPRLLKSAKTGSYVLIPENPDNVDESDGSSDVDLLGPRKKNLHKIVSVYAEILWAGKKLATEETVSQMIKQLKLCRRRSIPSTWRSFMLSMENHLRRNTHFDNVVESMFTIMDTAELQQKTRLLILEFILKKDIRIENSTQFFMKFLGKMLFMIEVIRNNPESETTESDDKNQDLTRVSAYGKMTLARIASALDEEHETKKS